MNRGMSFLVIAPWGQDIGFRLGGARVRIVPDAESLNAELEREIEKKETGVIALPETMRDWISVKNRGSIAKKVFPLLAFYHFPEKWAAPEEPAEDVAEIVQRAMGYRLNIRL